MAIFKMSLRALPIAERRFVRILVVTLFFFTASGISIFIPVSMAEVGRWIGMVIAILIGLTLRRTVASSSGIDILIWMLLLIFFISSLQSVAMNKSFLYLGVCVLQVILLTFLARKLSFYAWRFVFSFLAALCVFVSFMALGGYATSPDQYIVGGRLAGLSNANTIGLVAMLGVIICTANYWLVKKRGGANSRRLQNIYLVGAVGCVIAMVLTGSRGSLSGMLSGVLAVTFLAGKSSRLMLGLLLLIPFMVLYNLFGATDISELIPASYDRGGSDDLLYSRRVVWDLALAYFDENPWLGTGYAVHDKFGTVIDGSGYFGFLASVGFMGVFIYLSIAAWILFNLFSFGLKSSNPNHAFPEYRSLMVLGGGVIVGLLVQGVGEPWMIGPGSLMHAIYWLSAGACITGIMMGKRQKRLRGLNIGRSYENGIAN